MRIRNSSIVIAIKLVVLLSSTPTVAQEQNSAYSAGMSAYTSNQFEAARTHWLEAAEQNDGRAMFNLGLLHERQRIAGANENSAIDWFVRAGNVGYAPADYHLALKLQAGNQMDEATRLMTRAAAAGFILAQEQLGMVPTGNQANGQQSQTSKQSTASANNPIENTPKDHSAASTSTSTMSGSAGPRYQREEWILSQPENAWTVQMLAFSDESKVRSFIDDHALHRTAAYFAESRGEATIYKLIYGTYDTKQQADEARSRFTSALKEHGPWLRPMKGIQSLINRR